MKHFDNRSQLVYKLVTTVHEMKAEDRNQFKGNAEMRKPHKSNVNKLAGLDFSVLQKIISPETLIKCFCGNHFNLAKCHIKWSRQ